MKMIDPEATLHFRIADLEAENADLKKDLALNAGMLARQTDMAREAEMKQMQAERRLAALEQAAYKALDLLYARGLSSKEFDVAVALAAALVKPAGEPAP